MKRLFVFFCFLTLILFEAPPSAFAQKAPSGRATLVLDASGSMWGQIGGKAKINIARQAIKSLVRTMDPGVQLGLTAYGHNRKGDCTDIENLIPAGPNTGQEIISTVDKIVPTGMTPLSDAVRQAAEDLKYSEEKASVILVSDGLETCGADPCALARDLEESGADFVVHVIGFDLTPAERQSLQCLADETGGQFLPAGDATSLATALQTAVKQVAVSSGKAYTAVRPYLVDSQIKPNGLFQWTVTDASGTPVLTQSDFHLVEPLPSGVYTISASQLNTKGSTEIKVDQDNTKDHKIEINGGMLTLNALGEDGQPYESKGHLWWSLYPLDSGGQPADTYLTKNEGTSESFLLAPGRYLIKAEAGALGAETHVTITGGEALEETVLLESGQLVLTALTTAGGEIFKGVNYVWWSIYPLDETGTPTEKYLSKAEGVVETFDLPPGRYLAKAEVGAIRVETEVIVTPGKVTEVSVPLEAGLLTLTGLSRENGEKFNGTNYLWWSVFPLNDAGVPAKKYLNKAEGVVERFDLPAGDYLIKAEAGPITTETKTTVEAGKTREVSVSLNAAWVELTALKGNGQKYDGKDYVWWSVYPKGAEKYIQKGQGVVEPMDLPAGEYRVKVEVGKATFETGLSVTAGERKQISVTLDGL